MSETIDKWQSRYQELESKMNSIPLLKSADNNMKNNLLLDKTNDSNSYNIGQNNSFARSYGLVLNDFNYPEI